MLQLPVTLTHADATACLDQLASGVRQEVSTDVVIDAAALKRFDSSALAVLLALRRECARAGKRFSVKGLPDRLRDLAALYGIEALLTAA